MKLGEYYIIRKVPEGKEKYLNKVTKYASYFGDRYSLVFHGNKIEALSKGEAGEFSFEHIETSESKRYKSSECGGGLIPIGDTKGKLFSYNGIPSASIHGSYIIMLCKTKHDLILVNREFLVKLIDIEK